MTEIEGDQVSSAVSHGWSVRVSSTSGKEVKAYIGSRAVPIEKQAKFAPDDGNPSAVEYFLAAIGGDLVSGYLRQSRRRGVVVNAAEFRITGELDNALAMVGVVGVEGRPGFRSISGTLYVGGEAEERELREIWDTTLATSPLVNTLERCVRLSLELRLTT